jgi:hypothetical protein
VAHFEVDAISFVSGHRQRLSVLQSSWYFVSLPFLAELLSAIEGVVRKET